MSGEMSEEGEMSGENGLDLIFISPILYHDWVDVFRIKINFALIFVFCLVINKHWNKAEHKIQLQYYYFIEGREKEKSPLRIWTALSLTGCFDRRCESNTKRFYGHPNSLWRRYNILHKLASQE